MGWITGIRIIIWDSASKSGNGPPKRSLVEYKDCSKQRKKSSSLAVRQGRGMEEGPAGQWNLPTSSGNKSLPVCDKTLQRGSIGCCFEGESKVCETGWSHKILGIRMRKIRIRAARNVIWAGGHEKHGADNWLLLHSVLKVKFMLNCFNELSLPEG